MRVTARVADMDNMMQRHSKQFPEVGAVLEVVALAVINGVLDLLGNIYLIILHFLQDLDHGIPPIPIIPHLSPITRTKNLCYKAPCFPATQVNFRSNYREFLNSLNVH